MRLCYLVLLLSLFSLGMSDVITKPQRWVVDLDKAPEDRWPIEQMVPFYNASIHEAVALLNTALPGWLLTIAEDLAGLLIPRFGDYGLEIKSMAPKMSLPLGVAVLLNIFYEIEAACTSIVVQDSKGNIYHGRNLDFPLTQVLRHLVVEVEFQRGGRTLYYGTSYAGYVGLLTGLRPNAFSITLNQRYQGVIWENLVDALLIPGTRVAAFLIRDTLQNSQNFTAAANVLASTDLIAPSYITVGGVNPGEGVVISRDRLDTANLWKLDATTGGWFLAETNTDHWDPNYWCEGCRSTVARTGLESVGQDRIDLDKLFEVLSIPPVLNSATTYTTVMSVTQANMTTWIRSETQAPPSQ